MGERFALFFPMLLLAALAGVTWWLDQSLQGPQVRNDAILRHDPDYIAHRLTVVRMDPSGNVRYTLHAAKMIHYPDDDTTHLESPDFTNQGLRAPVNVIAKEGTVSANGEHVYFRNDVVVTRAAYADKSEMKLRTQYLHVIPEENVAKTDRPVTITDANTLVNAVGLEFNQDTAMLKLFSQVRGTYHDQKRKLRTPSAG